MHDRIKVNGRTQQLGNSVAIKRDNAKLTVTTSIAFSKRYLKYLTKKFMKKHQLKDWLRVVASSKENYEIRFYNVQQKNEEN